MSLTFQILPNRGIVYVRYDGTALIGQSARAFGEYAAHPDFAQGQRQLVDLSRITGFERNYPRLFDLQMRKADVFVKRNEQTLMVYYAPHAAGMALATLIARSWEGVPGTHPRIVDTTEADALHLLGEPEMSFDDLLASDPPRTIAAPS